MVTPVVYYASIFETQNWRLLKMLQTLFQFENAGDAFQYKWTKTLTFENDGVAAHIHSTTM